MSDKQRDNDLIALGRELAPSRIPLAEVVETELLPCPFCGSHAHVRSVRIPPDSSLRAYWVECVICEVGTKYHDSERGAATTWNTRATPPTPVHFPPWPEGESPDLVMCEVLDCYEPRLCFHYCGVHHRTICKPPDYAPTARGKAEVRTAPIGPIAGGASHEPTCGVWRGSSCDCVTRINNLAQEAAEVPAAWAKFRNSVGFQFGFVLYSELPAETAVDHVCKAAETLFAALSATTAPTPVEDERARGIAASKRDREQRLEQLATCKNGHDTRHYYGWLADIDYLLTRLSQAEARLK